MTHWPTIISSTLVALTIVMVGLFVGAYIQQEAAGVHITTLTYDEFMRSW